MFYLVFTIISVTPALDCVKGIFRLVAPFSCIPGRVLLSHFWPIPCVGEGKGAFRSSPLSVKPLDQFSLGKLYWTVFSMELKNTYSEKLYLQVADVIRYWSGQWPFLKSCYDLPKCSKWCHGTMVCKQCKWIGMDRVRTLHASSWTWGSGDLTPFLVMICNVARPQTGQTPNFWFWLCKVCFWVMFCGQERQKWPYILFIPK